MFSSNCVQLNTSSLLTTQPPFRFSMTLRTMVSSFVVSSEVTNYQSAVTAGTRQLEAMKTFITPKVWLNLQCLRPHQTLTHLNSQASDPKKDNIPVTAPNNHLRGKQRRNKWQMQKPKKQFTPWQDLARGFTVLASRFEAQFY